MMVKGLGHLAFVCKELETSIEFYERALGLKLTFRITYGDWLEHQQAQALISGTSMNDDTRARLEAVRDNTWIAYMALGDGTFIELFDAGGATEYALADFKRLNYQHFAILVGDIFEAQTALQKYGAPIDTPPALGLEGTWQMWTRDPDGNKIEFMQYTENSWQLVGKPSGIQ